MKEVAFYRIIWVDHNNNLVNGMWWPVNLTGEIHWVAACESGRLYDCEVIYK
jgi:hypothetical protein